MNAGEAEDGSGLVPGGESGNVQILSFFEKAIKI